MSFTETLLRAGYTISVTKDGITVTGVGGGVIPTDLRAVTEVKKLASQGINNFLTHPRVKETRRWLTAEQMIRKILDNPLMLSDVFYYINPVSTYAGKAYEDNYLLPLEHEPPPRMSRSTVIAQALPKDKRSPYFGSKQVALPFNRVQVGDYWMLLDIDNSTLTDAQVLSLAARVDAVRVTKTSPGGYHVIISLGSRSSKQARYEAARRFFGSIEIPIVADRHILDNMPVAELKSRLPYTLNDGFICQPLDLTSVLQDVPIPLLVVPAQSPSKPLARAEDPLLIRMRSELQSHKPRSKNFPRLAEIFHSRIHNFASDRGHDIGIKAIADSLSLDKCNTSRLLFDLVEGGFAERFGYVAHEKVYTYRAAGKWEYLRNEKIEVAPTTSFDSVGGLSHRFMMLAVQQAAKQLKGIEAVSSKAWDDYVEWARRNNKKLRDRGDIISMTRNWLRKIRK